MKVEDFGCTKAGERVQLITLEGGGLRCRIATYGGALVSLEVPDKAGGLVDVLLGFDTVADYEAQTAYMGGLIGRFANRIANGRFTLNGEAYTLPRNDGENHLHGGEGFDKRVWQAEPIEQGLRMTLTSPHMDEGYPGELRAQVDYLLRDGRLEIAYSATCDCDTICSLTSHGYFNLNGHAHGAIGSHVLKLYAGFYTPIADAGAIPKGEVHPVCGTPMDFTQPKAIGAEIDAPFAQLQQVGGYDHNWVIDGAADTLRLAAEVYAPESGIRMAVRTTSPGVQLYAGNALQDMPPGKGGAMYGRRSGFCLETQFYPNAPNQAAFPQPILRAGEVWAHRTAYAFG